MDSGNSSSLQSSSGGDDEEYDSRPESVPAFLNTSGHFSALSNPHPSLGSHQQHHPSPTFFDPSPNYLNPFSQSQLLNFDGIRPRGSLRSGPNCTDLGTLPGSSSSNQSMLGSQTQELNRGSFPSSSAHGNNGVRSSKPDQPTSVAKNPKKRTRASRRAPTTVLTTDTTNFRAMVQEFTGIPAPPFSGSSSYSRRLDLFGSGSSIRSGHLEPLGSLYPLRPSAKRVQPTPFVSSSSSPSLLNDPLVDASNITNTSTNTTIATTNAFNPSTYQNILNLQNQSPVLPFQSFLDPSPLNPSLNLPGFGVKSHGSSAMDSLDELGLSHGQVNANLGGLHSHDVAPDGARHGNWRDGVGLNQGNQDHLRALDWNYGTSDHNNSHEKGLENVSSRAEENYHAERLYKV